MRLGVLDIGSNTGHLLVVDAHGGAAPLPAYSYKEPLRLAEHLDDEGAVSQTGIDALTAFTAQALVVAEDKGCEEMLGFATSAVRDAVNSEAVLDHVKERTGVAIEVLSGEDEARLTFLAVRRWFGWSSGRLAVFDIGGVIQDSPLHAIARYERDHGLPPDAINRAVVATGERGAWSRLERGELAVEPGDEEGAAAGGHLVRIECSRLVEHRRRHNVLR